MKMNLAFKSLFIKNKDDEEISKSNQNHNKKEANVNPYLSARRSWNEHVGSVISSRQTWQVIGILSMLIALAAIGGVIHLGSQSKFIPYVVEVDSHGSAQAQGVIYPESSVPVKVRGAIVSDFIAKARLVTPDVALQRDSIFKVYSHLAKNDSATVKMNEWLNGSSETNPFSRAKTEMVSIQIESVLPQTDKTWQVDWIETVRDRSGTLKGAPVKMRAMVTIYMANTDGLSEKIQRDNPFGIYVRDFTWSKL